MTIYYAILEIFCQQRSDPYVQQTDADLIGSGFTEAVLGIRIRTFLGLPDPDPLVIDGNNACKIFAKD